MAIHVSRLDVCYGGKYKLNVQYVMYCIHSVYVHAYTYVPICIHACTYVYGSRVDQRKKCMHKPCRLMIQHRSPDRFVVRIN